MSRKFLSCILGVWLIAGISLHAQVAQPNLPPSVERLLQTAGAASYSQKTAYGAGIQDMVIGYGNDGKPIVGIAVRSTKTYKEVLTIVAVTPAEGSYKIAAAEIPDIGTFGGKSQTMAKDALEDITGKVFKNDAEARGLVDAVTGATQYYKAIYVSYALMASKVIEELTANPDWPRTTLQP